MPQSTKRFTAALTGVADTLRQQSTNDDNGRVTVSVKSGTPQLLKDRKQKKKEKHHSRNKVAVFHYSYYDAAFKFFVEQVLDADFILQPEATRRTMEVGSLHSNDFVCAPFKHILGDYIEALEMGANVLIQVGGPCRLGYYGELQESILRDLGYEFEMLNFAEVLGGPAQNFVKLCKKKVNPNISIPFGVKQLVGVVKMIEQLDAYNDHYLELAGFEVEPGSFAKARKEFLAQMSIAENATQINQVYTEGIKTLDDIPINRPANPIRVGIVGEFFTAVDAHGNLFVEDKLAGMGVSLARDINLTNRFIHYNEPNLRRSIPEYATYDMGVTTTINVASAKKYAQAGFDGLVHLKSSGCTPEIDAMPVLQRVSQDYHIPILYLSYDSQTSDTGLDTRLEAFYDMIAMRKVG